MTALSVQDGTGVLQQDPWLEPFSPALRKRYSAYKKQLDAIEQYEGGLAKFSEGYKTMGLQVDDKGGVRYREWAPNATEARLIGEFNDWSHTANPMTKSSYGVWECYVPPKSPGVCAIPHDSMIKISMTLPSGGSIDRIPAWITRVTQDLSISPIYEGRFWNPPETYKFKHGYSTRPADGLKIYEAHGGFRTVNDELTHVQMAIMEHAYYASFGYQVTNFFSASSRYGTPEELKSLIDKAHELGLTVLLDVVHSHACKNILDGYVLQQGGADRFTASTSSMARIINTSMGVPKVDMNFGTRASSIMANKLIHDNYPHAITIAEDVSGMPTLGRPVDEGGVGFDYRLSMAVPDMWIKMLKELNDDQWDMGNICHTLTNRRHLEKSVAYAESHDQALVGDKTLAFWLMDREMYTNMSDLTPLTSIVDRGLALHKMIRFIVHTLGGEAYLNFEGNEFGHPEWMDFPREGNGNSFAHARRQFNLVDDQLLRYKYLNEFDAYVSLKHEVDKVIVFERAGLLFIFNFHPTNSFTDYRVGVDQPGEYKVVLSSDEKKFGGHERIDLNGRYFTQPMEWNGRRNFLQVYTPARTVLVLGL
ncbi:hypothetical protein IAU60_003951 [Kwoniella sp. DSM 27419]